MIRAPYAGFVDAADAGSSINAVGTESGVSKSSDHSKYANRSWSPDNARFRTLANTTPSSWISWSTADPVYHACGSGCADITGKIDPIEISGRNIGSSKNTG